MKQRVVIIGAGAIGLGIAWRAAQKGLEVHLVDPQPGSGASGVAAGMLAPVTEAHYGEETLLLLNLASNAMYPSWTEELESLTGVSTGYRECGTLLVARDRDDDAALDHLFRFQAELGLWIDRLRGRECRELEPGLARGTTGGILVHSDHQIEPLLLVKALVAACELSGVNFVRSPALRVRGTAEGGAVDLGEDTSLEADLVVVAAGARSRDLVTEFGDLPVRPVKGQVVSLVPRGLEVPFDRNIRGLDVYMLARADGRVTVGATVEEVGFDTEPTAGGVHELLRRAYELVPGTMEMAFGGVTVGFRPGTPDNAPLLGAFGAPWLIAATGHYRNGILLTPITSERIVELLAEGDVSPEIAPFSPERFAVRTQA